MNSSSRHSAASSSTDTDSLSANEKDQTSFDETEKNLNTNDTSHQPASSVTNMSSMPSTTSSPNSTTVSASSTLSPPTPLPVPQNSIYNNAGTLTPSSNKIRYYINNNTNTLNKTNTLTHNGKYKNELSLMPSFNPCQQIFYDNSYMYRTFSYGPSYTPTPPHFYHQHPHPIQYHQHQPPITQLDLSSPVMRSQHHQHSQQHTQTQSQKKAPEYVSIRYFAPVEHVTSKLAKGETLNTATLRSKLPISSVQYIPNTGTATLISNSTYDDKRYYSTISSTNRYLKEGKINTATFKHFYEPNKNMVVNLESSQPQQLLSNNSNSSTNGNVNSNLVNNNSSGSLKNETSSSLNRSSLWNLTGNVTNNENNQRFYKEIKSENNLSKFYDRQGGSGGTLDKKSFSQKFGKTRKEKLKRNCTIVGTVFGTLAIVIIVASVVLCTALPNSIFKGSFSGARSLFKEEASPVTSLNTTNVFFLQNETNINLNQTNVTFLGEKTLIYLNQTKLNLTGLTTQIVEFDEPKITTTTAKISTEEITFSTQITTASTITESTTLFQDIQEEITSESTSTTISTTQVVDTTSSLPVEPTIVITTTEIEPLTIATESTTISNKIQEIPVSDTTTTTTTTEKHFAIDDNALTSTVSIISSTPLISPEAKNISPQKRFLFKNYL